MPVEKENVKNYFKKYVETNFPDKSRKALFPPRNSLNFANCTFKKEELTNICLATVNDYNFKSINEVNG